MANKTRELDARDYHKAHPYMKSLDTALKQYSVVKVNDVNGAHHGEDYEEMRVEILNSLFHPQPQSLGDHQTSKTRVVMGVCFGERDDTTEGEKDFDNSAIQYHGKTKNYKKQQPENET